jgi:adenine deaminase
MVAKWAGDNKVIDSMIKEDLVSILAAACIILLVIPHLKLSDLVLFDGDGLKFIEL